jgi:hypothetical protein
MVCVSTAKARFYRDELRDQSDFDEGAWAEFLAADREQRETVA